MQIFAKLLYRKFEVSTLYLGVGFISGESDRNVQSVGYKLHVIKRTVNPINGNDYMLRLNLKQNSVVLYVVPIRCKLNVFTC